MNRQLRRARIYWCPRSSINAKPLCARLRVRRDELVRLGNLQDSFGRIEMLLGENHLEGATILEKLDQGQGNFEIRDVKYDGPGGLVLKPANHPQLGFPSLETVVPGINMSYKEYLAKLAELDKEIQGVHAATDDLLNKEKEVTERLLGEVDKDGNPVRDKSGAVVQPGWRYLVEAERNCSANCKRSLNMLSRSGLMNWGTWARPEPAATF